MNKKRSVIDSISKLNQLQLDELLKIVSDNNVAYMENTNGYFIYLKDIEDEIVDKLYDHIQYCLANKSNTTDEDSFHNANMQYIQEYLDKNEEKLPELVIHSTKKKKANHSPPNLMSPKKQVSLTNSQLKVIELSKII